MAVLEPIVAFLSSASVPEVAVVTAISCILIALLLNLRR